MLLAMSSTGLCYADWWEAWPCEHCKRIFADCHDRSTWFCPISKFEGLARGVLVMLPDRNRYKPMGNLEYLETKVQGEDNNVNE